MKSKGLQPSRRHVERMIRFAAQARLKELDVVFRIIDVANRKDLLHHRCYILD
jgi:hypothetical protein